MRQLVLWYLMCGTQKWSNPGYVKESTDNASRNFAVGGHYTSDQLEGPETERGLIEQVEQAIVRQTNEFRGSNQLETVSSNEELQVAASEFAKFMARTGKYGHSADGSSPAQRAKAAGYKYCVVRENIAYRLNTGDVTAEGP